MPGTKATQIGNKVQGDQAGRDINKTYKLYTRKQTPISHLNEKYVEECENESEVCEYIQSLLHYIERKSTDFLGLEKKLEIGKKDQDYIDFAKKQKELFAKRLIKRDLSPTAQRIFALILGKIKLHFQHSIVPKIKSHASHEEIEQAILVEVINPVFDELEENVLELTYDEMSGMLYYLTGNCHLNWI